MSNNIYLYIVFISQIILVSWYIPHKILNRMNAVITKYPAYDYPKLYPKPIESYRKGQGIYKIMNQVLFLIGIIILLVLTQRGYFSKGEISQFLPCAYFMVQMLPMLYLEMSELSNFKEMKKVNMEAIRTAELLPRRLMDFVSVKVVWVWGIMTFSTIFVTLYFYHFETKAFEYITILLGMNIFFAGIVFWNIKGKKIDPHLSNADRLKVLKAMVISLFYISISISIFFMVTMIINRYKLDYLEPIVMSVYCQTIAVISIASRLRVLKLQEIDFDVYKDSKHKNMSNA